MTVIGPIRGGGCGCGAAEGARSAIALDAALALIEQSVPRLSESDRLPLAEACGRVLAEPVKALGRAPAFDNSAMDGYALSCAALAGDGPWTLPVSERIPAGQTSRHPFTGTHAVRIFTGAPLPMGADAVIAQEEVVCGKGIATIARRPDPGLNIRLAGADMCPGDRVLERGARLGPREIAACAAAGASHPAVVRRLRVSILVTGNEVQDVGADRRDAAIWDVNTPMITAALSGAQIDLVDVQRGADNREALQRTIIGLAERSDLLVTTGGISVGEEDHVRPVIQSLGAVPGFSGVAIKPGKPVSFGRVGNAIWLGLPGNPLSAFVTWQVFGTAVLRTFLGMERPRSARRHVVLAKCIVRKPGRCELRPAHVVGFDAQGREIVGFDDSLNSGHVAALAQADGLILLPPEIDAFPEGALVEFQPFCTELG